MLQDHPCCQHESPGVECVLARIEDLTKRTSHRRSVAAGTAAAKRLAGPTDLRGITPEVCQTVLGGLTPRHVRREFAERSTVPPWWIWPSRTGATGSRC